MRFDYESLVTGLDGLGIESINTNIINIHECTFINNFTDWIDKYFPDFNIINGKEILNTYLKENLVPPIDIEFIKEYGLYELVRETNSESKFSVRGILHYESDIKEEIVNYLSKVEGLTLFVLSKEFVLPLKRDKNTIN